MVLHSRLALMAHLEEVLLVLGSWSRQWAQGKLVCPVLVLPLAEVPQEVRVQVQ